VSAFTFSARLWEHAGQGAWHFVTLPDDTSDEIADLTAGVSRGFGSVRVRVTVGGTTWQTSLFPDTTAGAYVLPVKKAVRAAEGLAAGDLVEVALSIAGR
jgi:Domain of unknown function (DUF1905)